MYSKITFCYKMLNNIYLGNNGDICALWMSIGKLLADFADFRRFFLLVDGNKRMGRSLATNVQRLLRTSQ